MGADDLIKSHVSEHSETPLFLYLPFQDVHSPLQVPDEYLELYPEVKNEARRKLLAKASALDDAIGQIISALKSNGLYENSIIVFTSDNGGQVLHGGNNYPL